MRKGSVAAVAMLSSIIAVACTDTPVGVEALEVSDPAKAVSTGEKYVGITIDNPAKATFSMKVGAQKQMAATLHYNRGGTLPSQPYAAWSSTDPCVATVTSASPSWGKVKGVSAGKARIIATAFGKSDTVLVTVKGDGNLNPNCEAELWSWDYKDVSFTGEPAGKYSVKAGEKLTQVVLFAPKDPIAVGGKVRLQSEMWYNKGGKLNANRYVTFSTSDGSIARVNDKGVVTGRKKGRVKIYARLGQYADSVPVYVK